MSELPDAENDCLTDPPRVDAYARLAQAQERAGQLESALQTYLTATLLQAAKLAPQDASAWLNLGLAFHRNHAEPRALSAFRAALACYPAMAEAWNNLGGLSPPDIALPAHRRAVQLAPQRADFHNNLAHALLGLGHFAEGFREWEWRTPSPPRDFAEPRWRGEALAGQTLLIHAEQGYGDSLQFARYVPLAAARGGRIIVETRDPLKGLLGRLEGVAATTRWNATLPPFDCHIALPSLASLFPMPDSAMAYLRADPERISLWRDRLATQVGKTSSPRIGLVWSGNPRSVDPRRAIPFAAIAQLAANHPGYRFFGLQREFGDDDVGFPQLGGAISDFDDLAAAMSLLDLVISVDTAAAHLAGGLGLPVWVLLHSAADWRWWGHDPDRTVWYPTARLFRQQQAGDWPEVIGRVGKALRALYSSR
jgi:hypothetical protein